jgi:ABC-2 type transport system permease protein
MSARPLPAQTRVELTLTARRGDSLLLIVGIPLGLLVFFSLADVLPTGTDDPVDFLAPGVIALAVMSTAMVQTAIGTAFERQYLVLKRLGVTPLGRPRLLVAKIVAMAAVIGVQLVLLGGVGVALGWSPDAGGVPAALAAVVLATLAFGGIGFAMAGRLRGEVTLAAANGLYLVLLLLGGMVIDLDELPGWLADTARLLPAAALSDAVHGTLGAAGGVPGRAWAVLAVWAVLAPLAAIRVFRWE